MQVIHTSHTQCSRCLTVLRGFAQQVFGPAFPDVDFRIYAMPLRIEIRSVITREGQEVICCGGRFVDGNGDPEAPLLPHRFDVGHFSECRQAITAFTHAETSWHDFDGPESYGAVS